jgi:hypothetical protein
MVHDLLESHLLEGKTHQEVDELLGPGPYCVGSAGHWPLPTGFSFSYSLYFEYDKEGKVKEVILGD